MQGNKKVKIYTYARVSTVMQAEEGYSLEAQCNKFLECAKYRDYEIVGQYVDAGKSGKNIKGRPQFQQMMADIMQRKDDVSFVLVYSLSRFGRNSVDTLTSIHTLQEYGVNLITIKGSINSSDTVGKLTLTILSAVAEMDRENILAQTREGKIEKAKQGEWNGGKAPYGYCLVDGKLEIFEDEAEHIRLIFKMYVESELGANSIAKNLKQLGIMRNGYSKKYFEVDRIRRILSNPVYNGKITYGRRTNKTDSDGNLKVIQNKEFMMFNGKHEAIIDDEMWELAQKKREDQAGKFDYLGRSTNNKTHILSGILKCPKCGGPLYGNKACKKNKSGKEIYYYYNCKGRTKINGVSCTYGKQIHGELIENAVLEVVMKSVNNKVFAEKLESIVKRDISTEHLDVSIKVNKKEIQKNNRIIANIEEQMVRLEYDFEKHGKVLENYQRQIEDAYGKIEEHQINIVELSEQKMSIEEENRTLLNIKQILESFGIIIDKMNDDEKKVLVHLVIKEIHIYEERKSNGQWLKSIIYKLPIIKEEVNIGLDIDNHAESVALLVKDQRDEEK